MLIIHDNWLCYDVFVRVFINIFWYSSCPSAGPLPTTLVLLPSLCMCWLLLIWWPVSSGRWLTDEHLTAIRGPEKKSYVLHQPLTACRSWRRRVGTGSHPALPSWTGTHNCCEFQRTALACLEDVAPYLPPSNSSCCLQSPLSRGRWGCPV